MKPPEVILAASVLEVCMISAWWLIPVLFIGAVIGFLLAALLTAGRNGK